MLHALRIKSHIANRTSQLQVFFIISHQQSCKAVLQAKLIRNSQFAIFSPEYPADTVIQLPLVSSERCQAGKGQQGVRGETS